MTEITGRSVRETVQRVQDAGSARIFDVLRELQELSLDYLLALADIIGHEPEIHKDGTPEWYTWDGKSVVQAAEDTPETAIRIYPLGGLNTEWYGTLGEAEQVAKAMLSAVEYLKERES